MRSGFDRFGRGFAKDKKVIFTGPCTAQDHRLEHALSSSSRQWELNGAPRQLRGDRRRRQPRARSRHHVDPHVSTCRPAIFPLCNTIRLVANIFLPDAAGCSTANHPPLVGSGILAGAGTWLEKASFVSVILAGATFLPLSCSRPLAGRLTTGRLQRAAICATPRIASDPGCYISKVSSLRAATL